MQHTHIKTVTNCRGISHPNNRPNSLCVLVLLSHNVPSHCDQITTFKGGFPRLLFKHLKIIKNYVVVFSTTTIHSTQSSSYLYAAVVTCIVKKGDNCVLTHRDFFILDSWAIFHCIRDLFVPSVHFFYTTILHTLTFFPM